MTKPARIYPLVLAAILFLGACSGDSSSVGRPSMLADAVFDTVAAVGALDGEPWEVFGSIDDVAIHWDGGFVILDSRAAAVYLFDASGRFMDGITARGEGPGDLNYPYRADWSEDGRLLVLDIGSARISAFRRSNASILFDGSRQITMQGEFCVLGNRVFLYSSGQLSGRDEPVIHEIGPGGEVLQSFSSLAAVDIAGSWSHA